MQGKVTVAPKVQDSRSAVQEISVAIENPPRMVPTITHTSSAKKSLQQKRQI